MVTMKFYKISMKKILLYTILVCTGLLFACQKSEVANPDPNKENIGKEVTISFSAILPSDPTTKAMGDDPNTDIQSLHLVIFDGNGMYVETREAKSGATNNHTGHPNERKFEVTLTVTDQPRIIHYIANCPIDQIVYGHEASIIGNMYVEKGNTPNTAYWARVKVPHILVEETSENSGLFRPASSIIDKFQCVPMLRNYAQIVVRDSDNTTEFELIGFTVYNTIDLGTVAPYNNTTQTFQNFIDSATNSAYKYPYLAYKGHALAAAALNTSLEKDSTTDDGIKWYTSDNPFYMYERKVSVKTDEEEKWSESPPHVIIKGRYNNKITYYKVDLVYDVYEKDENGNDTEKVTDIVYYNILRNFRYQFTISEVAGKGYDNVDDAVNGSTSNNISGSASTSKFTNISDEVGRIWVSYTDTTLVSNNTITLKYKYIPNISNPNADNYEEVNNNLVHLEGITGGDVISDVIATRDINEGIWLGYREITLTINEPADMTKEQEVMVKTDNANLTRQVRYYLKKKYPAVVQCDPKKVATNIGESVTVNIKLPVGLTADMFPLHLDIEVEDMTLSPDASVQNNDLPVTTGKSVIPQKDAVTFHFTKSIETLEEYDALTTEGNMKIIPTYWVTNIEANESRIHVVNKYFEDASDNWVNAKAFESLTLNNGNTVREGAGRTVSATLVLPASDNSYASRNIKFTLEGLSLDGSTEPFYITPTSRTITINNLVTTDANSTLTIKAEEESYAEISASVGRRRGTFSNLTFSQNNNTVTSVPLSSAQNVTFSFEMSDYENGMPVTVVLEGFETTKAEYTHTVSGTGKQTISLTAPADVSNCSVKLKAEGYDDSQIVSLERSDAIIIQAGKLITRIEKDNGFANGGTINIFYNSQYTGTSVDYKYTRSDYSSGWFNTYDNGQASNTSAITLSNVTNNDTLYIRYKNGNTVYTGSFRVSDAIDSDGVTITLTQK